MNRWQTIQLCEIKEVWESFSGWYWFVTEYHEGTIAFGLVKGWEIEWGYFDLAELHRLAKRAIVWKVPKRNWEFCPCVVEDADSCSRLKVGAARERQDEKAMPGLPAVRGAVPRRVAQTQGAAQSDAGLHSLRARRRYNHGREF